MNTGKRFGLFIGVGLLTLALLSACGSPTTPIPATATIFYAHAAIFGSNSSSLLTTGYNGFGQLGNGNLNTESVLASVVGLTHVDKVATGGDHTLALVFSNHSSIYAWGSNYHGQLGNATVGGVAIPTTGSGAYSDTPVKIPLHGLVTDISAGGFHSLAVVADPATGIPTAYAWGYNGFGQLGNQGLVDSSLPVQVQQAGQNALGNITAVAAGGGHSLALDSDGFVYAWGDNAYGQVGTDPTAPLGAFATSANQVQVITVTPPSKTSLTNIAQIAAGASTSYALTNDGTTVWAWGYNGMAQLAMNPALTGNPFALPGQQVNLQVNSYNPVAVTIPLSLFSPTGLPAGTTILKIAAGLDHVLALLSNHTVMAWGFNNFGQVGNNNNSTTPFDNSRVFTPVLVLTGGSALVGSGTTMTGVTDIKAFGNSSMARVNGVWYGWGDNSFGQLGNPVSATSIGFLLIPAIVQGFK